MNKSIINYELEQFKTINNNGKLYNSMFEIKQINNTLKEFRDYIPNDVHLMSTPLYLQKDNDKFFNEFKTVTKSNPNLIIFLIYVNLNTKILHTISGCYDIINNTMDLYDNNAENGSEYFQMGLTKNVFGKNVFNKNPYSPCINMVYQMTFHMFNVKLNKHITGKAFTDRALIPTYCIPTRNGVCAFWALLYIVLRSLKVTYNSAPIHIFNVSQKAKTIKPEQQFQFLVDLLKKSELNKHITQLN